MTVQSQKKPPQSNTFARWSLVAGCGGVVLLLVVGCVCLWFFVLRGNSAPITASAAERITGEFVQALHDGEMRTAHQILSEKIRSGISDDDTLRFVGGDENQRVISTYQSLKVCDWGFFVINGERVVSVKGLLHYQTVDVVFESSLHKDSDNVWRVYGFQLKPEIDPKPFGRCN